MDPITLVLGVFSLITSIALAARDRRDQNQANKHVMDFNAEEAEKSRVWQEEQYNKYESVAAQMQQRQQAGLSPFDGIASMSVGSGSTASSSANQISPLSHFDASLFSQLPGMANQVKQTKLQNNLLSEQTEGAKLDNETKRLHNLKLAIEADDYASYYSLVKQGLEKSNNLTDEQIKKAFEEARIAHVAANNAEGAEAAGINPVVDQHNESVARVSKIFSDIESADSRLQLDWAKYNLDKKLTEENIIALSRDNEFAKQVQERYNVDYNSLPSYLKIMASGIILLEKQLNTKMFDTLGERNQFREKLNQLKADFETYYLEYLKNSSDTIATQAGNHLTDQNILSAILGIVK